jgi:hypothetical protein
MMIEQLADNLICTKMMLCSIELEKLTSRNRLQYLMIAMGVLEPPITGGDNATLKPCTLPELQPLLTRLGFTRKMRDLPRRPKTSPPLVRVA